MCKITLIDFFFKDLLTDFIERVVWGQGAEGEGESPKKTSH